MTPSPWRGAAQPPACVQRAEHSLARVPAARRHLRKPPPVFPKALPAPGNPPGTGEAVSEGHRFTAALLLRLANGQFLSPARVLAAWQLQSRFKETESPVVEGCVGGLCPSHRLRPPARSRGSCSSGPAFGGCTSEAGAGRFPPPGNALDTFLVAVGF